MTFTDIVNEVMARTRQTSAEATTRVGRAVNDRYLRVVSAIGLQTSARREAPVTVTANQSQATINECEKVYAVFLTTPVKRVLREWTYDQWRASDTMSPSTGIPYAYALEKQMAGIANLRLYPTPDQAYAMKADTLWTLSPLSLGDLPWWPSNFHDILVHGALSDEWMQLKQDDLSKRSEATYEQRLSELRYFIVKSAYLDIHQGARSLPAGGAYWPGYFIRRWWG